LASGLVTPDQWDAAASAAGMGSGASEDVRIARVLVRQGILTDYQADQLRAGRSKLSLGPYLITEWIGQGGMGQVFKAVHRVMGREVAVKVLPLEKATEEARQAFMREIRLQAGLDCPYLVRAFDAGQDGRVHYLVTEYVPGTDLRQLVRIQGRLSMRQAARVVMQAALGLDYAHRQGLVHRDVKPGNILVTPDGRAKVSDVGLAAWATSLIDDPRAGKIVGTADYLSPEQIRTPLNVGPSTDIYALGCTLYYSVCGKVPFPGGDTASKIRRHLEETPWHPRRFNPDLSEEFVDTIADMMEKDPRARIANAAEVAARLEVWAGDAPTAMPVYERVRWQPAPPPADELQGAGDFIGSGEGGGSQTSQQSSQPRPASDDSNSPAPVPATSAPLMITSSAEPRGSSIPVAIALAIAIPLSLLLGAIAGFLVRERLMP
jgi:serine/threonine protein kinase